MEETIQRTFDTREGSTLVVENIQGPITIEGWDKAQTDITATRHQDWAQVDITQEGEKVVARTKAGEGASQWLGWFGSKRSARVDYAIRVPYATNLEIKNVSGPIAVRQCKGQMRANSVDGKVTIEDVTGEVRAETVNGALSATRLDGKADLKTVNGGLSLEESQLSGLSAQTVNGKIRVSAQWAANAQISLQTVNGDCLVKVPADFRAAVSAHGINVSVKCGQEEPVKRQFGGWQGSVGPDQDGEPEARISFHTVNGNLCIDNSGPAVDTPSGFVAKAKISEMATPVEGGQEPMHVKVDDEPQLEAFQEAPPAETPSPLTELEILQMVERGEITVQEAIEMMQK
jgi:hypothetical protein